MRAATLTGDGRVVVVEQPDPRASGDLVVVQILVAPLCTEFKARHGGARADHLGHEAAGVVVDAGSSTLVAVGDRVVVMPQFACGRCWLCQRGEHIHCPYQRDVLAETGSRAGIGTVAQFVIKPDWLLIKVPETISLEHASMACCGFGPTFTAHQRLRSSLLDEIVVSGCGPVGLGAIVQGVARGARMIALETHPYRAELASQLGAVDVLDPRSGGAVERVRELTSGRGAAGAVETSGAPTAAGAAADMIRVRGGLALVAWTQQVVLPTPIPHGLDVYACWHWNHALHLAGMLTMIAETGPAIETMITHRFDLEDVSAAMDLQDRGECGKILVHPFGAEEAAR